MPKYRNQEEAIALMSKKYNDFYDYSNFIYLNNKNTSEIICPRHGTFYKSFCDHYTHSAKCKKCKKEEGRAKNNYTTENVIQKSKEKHGDRRFNYDKLKYVNWHTKMEIKCLKCNQWIFANVNSHLNSNSGGCPNCNPGAIKTEERLIKNFNEKYGENTFSYENMKYLNSHTDINIKCLKCNKHFKRTPNEHLNRKGCPYCYWENLCYTTETITEAFKEKNGTELFNYEEVKWVDCKTKVTVKCLKCNNNFQVMPFAHLNNASGCPDCWIESISGENSPHWISDRELVELRKKTGSRMRSLLKEVKKNHQHSRDILGYDEKQLFDHIVNHPNWEKCKNSNWHLDHYFPVSAFVSHNISNPRIINSLTNLQPLSKEENLSKGDVYDIDKFLIWLKQFTKEELEINYETLVNECKKYENIVSKNPNCFSKYLGVVKQKNMFRVGFSFKNKYIYIGIFATEEDAAKHFDFYYLKYKNLQPNFPNFDYSDFIPTKIEKIRDKKINQT